MGGNKDDLIEFEEVVSRKDTENDQESVYEQERDSDGNEEGWDM